jgi:hypothetical protein
MPSSEQNSTNGWAARIHGADRKYQDWEGRFKCKKLVEYYENFQWKLKTGDITSSDAPYVLNLFHSTIEIKLASYLFQRPSFVLTPEPGKDQWDQDFAVQSAQIKQDTLNTIIKNRNMKFAKVLKRAALDAFFRFSIIEVGYAADWRNPLKDEVELKSWTDPDLLDSPKDKVVKNEEVPTNERFFVKRIKPERFRVSVSDAEELEDHEWVGYYQYYYTDTLKNTPGIKFPENAGGSYISKDIGEGTDTNLEVIKSGRQISKVYHIWDMVAKKRRMLLADSEFDEIWSQDFERHPLIDLKWFIRTDGFYPIPPCWYWLSPQDEINESREQVRSFRRRFTRKYEVIQNQIDPEEIEKFVSGGDGSVVLVKQAGAILPIPNPEIGATAQDALIQAKEDFLVVSGTSAEARPGGDRETATKSKIADARARIRESAEQIDFSEFVCTIGREILAQASEKLVEGLWVKYSNGPGNEALQDYQANQQIYKWITSQDLSDGYDFDVAIDIQNATPAAMEKEREAFTSFIAFITQFPFIAMSPILIREAAYRFGYKNEAVIHQVQQTAAAAMAAKAAEAAKGNFGPAASLSPDQSGAVGGGGNANNTAKSQMATPDLATIGDQLTNQLQ